MFLLVIGLGGAAGDQLAERIVTGRAEASLVARGVSDPQLEVGGFPFLTQLARGEFGKVTLTAPSVRVGPGSARRIRAVGTGVGRPSAGRVSVQRLTASGIVAYDDVLHNAGLDRLRLEPEGPRRVRLSGDVDVLGRTVTVSVLSRVRLRARTLDLVPDRVQAAGLPATVSAGLTDRLRLSYRIPELPEGLRVREVTAVRQGFQVLVTGEGLELS